MDVKEQWAIREARRNLAQTARRYPELRDEYKNQPEVVVGYLKATVELALRDLNAFAEANPEFTKWS